MTTTAAPAVGWLAAASTVAGFVDTACFLALDGLFTAHVTGNFVLAGAVLVDGRPDALLRLAALPVFALAVAVASWLVARARRRGTDAARALLWLQGLALAGLAAASQFLPDAEPVRITMPSAQAAGAAAVVAMGVQNLLFRALLPSLPATTVMTGNFTAFVAEAGVAAASPAASLRRRQVAVALAGFAGGAALAAVALRLAGHGALLVPVGLWLLACLASRRTFESIHP